LNFLLDHDVPVDVLRVLQREGHQAQRSVEFLGREAADVEIFELAKTRKFILISCNRDHFLRLAKDDSHPGLIILIRRRSRQAELAHLLALLRSAGANGIIGNINFA
jgi:predicted nuclease of predicted toxin-antitoxin system